jgi:rod shape-determining protein MreD
MVDPLTMRRFLFRCLFAGLCALIIFLNMLPLTTQPRMIPGPDLLFCLTAAWIMRRPRWAPVGLIVVMHVIADLLFMRPLGLWPAITLLAYEYLRRKARNTTEITPVVEITMVSATFAAAVAVNVIVLFVFAVPQASLAALLLHVIVTALAYPLVIGFSVFVAGVRRAKPTDIDDEGIAA